MHFSVNAILHDLTRCTGEGSENFARLNMPMELGMAIAYKLLGPIDEPHQWLALVPQGHTYSRFISDLSGFDPAPYDGTKRGVISQVISWLWTHNGSNWTPTPEEVISRLSHFESALQVLRARWEPADPPWSEIVQTAIANKPV